MAKITKDTIIGKKAPPTRIIEIKAYGGATLEIRALSVLELTKILLNLKKKGYNLENLGRMSGRKLYLSDLPVAFDLCSEACKLGIVDKEIRDMVDDLMFGSTFEIGGAILTLTIESLEGSVGPLTKLLNLK